MGGPRDAVTDDLGQSDEVVTPQGGARLDPSGRREDPGIHCIGETFNHMEMQSQLIVALRPVLH